MTGELFTIEVENITDNKIGRGGKIFLPKSTRTASVSAYGLAEIRACRGLVIHTPALVLGEDEEVKVEEEQTVETVEEEQGVQSVVSRSKKRG